MELPGKICALNLYSHWASGAGVLGWLTNNSVYPAGLKAILVKQDENTLGCEWLHVLYKDIVLGKNILYFNRFIYSSILYVYEYFTCMYECAPCACLLPTQVRRLWISWKETYRLLWVTIWVLGTEPQPSARAISALNSWSIFPFLWGSILYFYS